MRFAWIAASSLSAVLSSACSDPAAQTGSDAASDAALSADSDATWDSTTAAVVVAACNPAPGPGAWSMWNCPQAMCGNGKADSCQKGGEQCDGLDLQGETCVTQGYASGAISCDPACQLDARKCESCGSGGQITACTHPTLSGVAPIALALSAQASEIGVAWLEQTQPDPPHLPRLHFSRFQADLSLLSDTACVGLADTDSVSLAALPSGWLLASHGTSGCGLTRLDATGAATGTHPLAGAQLAQLAERPDGGPLLLWTEPPAHPNTNPTPLVLHVQLLMADGAFAGPDVTVTDVNFGWTGVFVGDGFELAINRFFAPGDEVVQLYHLSLDGKLRTDTAIPGSQMYGISLAWSGTEARLGYETFVTTSAGSAPQTFLQRVAGDGTFVGDRIAVDVLNTYGAYPLLAMGADTVVLQAPDTGEMNLANLLRVGISGQPIWPAVPVVRAGVITSIGLAQQGGDAIIAWVEAPRGGGHPNPADPVVQNRLGLARVKLTL